ncbi:MAG: hypothetical protein NTW87_37395 [Planctomycetota bacterium]|nr:hypothetical protein [Planctomycetota bacterium]
MDDDVEKLERQLREGPWHFVAARAFVYASAWFVLSVLWDLVAQGEQLARAFEAAVAWAIVLGGVMAILDRRSLPKRIHTAYLRRAGIEPAASTQAPARTLTQAERDFRLIGAVAVALLVAGNVLAGMPSLDLFVFAVMSGTSAIVLLLWAGIKAWRLSFFPWYFVVAFTLVVWTAIRFLHLVGVLR